MNVQASNHRWFVFSAMVLLLVAVQDLQVVMSHSGPYSFSGLARYAQLMANGTDGPLSSNNFSTLGGDLLPNLPTPPPEVWMCVLKIFEAALCDLEAVFETKDIAFANPDKLCKVQIIAAPCTVNIACLKCTDDEAAALIKYENDIFAQECNAPKWKSQIPELDCKTTTSLKECDEKETDAESSACPLLNFPQDYQEDPEGLCKKVDKLIACTVKPICELCDKEASQWVVAFAQKVLNVGATLVPCQFATVKCPIAVWVWVVIGISAILLVSAIVGVLVFKPFSSRADPVYPKHNFGGSKNAEAVWSAAPTSAAGDSYGGQPPVEDEEAPMEGEEADQKQPPPPPSAYRSKIKYASSAGAGEAWPKSSAGSLTKQPPPSGFGPKGGRPQSKAKMAKRASAPKVRSAASMDRARSGEMKVRSRVKSNDYLDCKSRVGSTGKMKVKNKAKGSKTSSGGKMKYKKAKGAKGKGSRITPKSRTY